MGHSAKVSDYKASYEVIRDRNGIDLVVLRNPQGDTAMVNLHAGQTISWRNTQGDELLFTSRKVFRPSKATMRGGIPVCFPELGNSDSLEVKGLARNRGWTIDDNPPPLYQNDYHEKSFVDLILKPSKDDLSCFPHSFEFRLRISLAYDGNLNLISRVRNLDCKPFSFSFAYHTYLSVSDISEVRIEGLETLNYLDNLSGGELFTEQCDSVTFESEVDRAYLRSPNFIAVLDHNKKQTIVIRKDGLPDTVVWNPWDKKSKSMPDFGDAEYKKMVCVDGAAVETPIMLKPGQEWTGRLELELVPSTLRSDNLDPRLSVFRV